MSRSLLPRTLQDVPGQEVHLTAQRVRKISTACGACKQRKTRCSGGTPCDACITRNSQCTYDVTSDQRRKIANQRNIQELAETQHDLERHQQLLGGIIATIRAGDSSAIDDLIQRIRSGADLSSLAAHVRNECRSDLNVQQAYVEIDFVIDGENELPPPSHILQDNQQSMVNNGTGEFPMPGYLLARFGGDDSMF